VGQMWTVPAGVPIHLPGCHRPIANEPRRPKGRTNLCYLPFDPGREFGALQQPWNWPLRVTHHPDLPRCHPHHVKPLLHSPTVVPGTHGDS
jgi:hypothetical protein